MAALASKLSHICPFKLNEIYEILFELHQRLNISDDFYSNITRIESEDQDQRDNLEELLKSSKEARDNLITWYHKQTLFEFHVTISLLTAKIRFIEYKLGRCEPFDLHQSCSIALVDFTNVIAELTNHDSNSKKRKTMTMVSTELNLPIWTSQYRNLICHAPVESPNIKILIELVAKALEYMNKSFWSRVIDRNTFDTSKCSYFIEAIAKYTNITSINQSLAIRKDIQFSKSKKRIAERDVRKCKFVCAKFKSITSKHTDQVVELVLQFILQSKPTDKTKNFALLLEHVFLTKDCFEKLAFTLLALMKEKRSGPHGIEWFTLIINIISYKSTSHLKKTLAKINMQLSIRIIRSTNIPPIKCCHLAYQLCKLSPVTSYGNILLRRLRYKLYPILGKEKSLLLFKASRIAAQNIHYKE